MQGQAPPLLSKMVHVAFEKVVVWMVSDTEQFLFSLSNDRPQARLSPHRLGRVVHRAFAGRPESETTGREGSGREPSARPPRPAGWAG